MPICYCNLYLIYKVILIYTRGLLTKHSPNFFGLVGRGLSSKHLPYKKLDKSSPRSKNMNVLCFIEKFSICNFLCHLYVDVQARLRSINFTSSAFLCSSFRHNFLTGCGLNIDSGGPFSWMRTHARVTSFD